MRAPPPEEVASWPEPNFVNPETQGPRLTGVGIMLVTVSFIVVALRLWVRLGIKRTAGLDDWLLVSSLPAVLALTILSILSLRVGFGLHIWDNKPEWSKPSRVILYIIQILVVVVATLVKVSLLISYLRFFTTKISHRATWVMIVINLVHGVASLFVSIFACIPPQHYWSNLIGEVQGCQNETTRMMSISSINIATEAMVLILPLLTLWRLHLPVKERVTLIIVMSLGFTACVASILRVYVMYNVLETTYDITWTGYNIYLFVIVELNLGIICASIPTLRPLVQQLFPNSWWSRPFPRYPSYTNFGNNSFLMGPRADFEEMHPDSKETG